MKNKTMQTPFTNTDLIDAAPKLLASLDSTLGWLGAEVESQATRDFDSTPLSDYDTAALPPGPEPPPREWRMVVGNDGNLYRPEMCRAFAQTMTVKVREVKP